MKRTSVFASHLSCVVLLEVSTTFPHLFTGKSFPYFYSYFKKDAGTSLWHALSLSLSHINKSHHEDKMSHHIFCMFFPDLINNSLIFSKKPYGSEMFRSMEIKKIAEGKQDDSYLTPRKFVTVVFFNL